MGDKTAYLGRRSYLATAGVLLSGAIAGCSGGESSNEEPEPQDESTETTNTGTAADGAAFSEISIDVPSAPSVRSQITVTVSASNTGGEQGTFTDRLAVVEGNSSFQQQVEIPDIEPGETGTAEFTLTFQYVDEYVLALETAGVDESVEPAALTRTTGESLSVGNSLRLTLDDVSFQQTVPVTANRYGYYVNADGDGVFEAPTGQILGLVRFTLENIGTSTDQLGFDSLAGPNDNVYTSLGESGITAVNVSDPFLFGSNTGYGDNATRIAELEPSQQRSGWVLAQFPRDSARQRVELDFQADDVETPTEATFVHSAGQTQFGFPQYRLDDLYAQSADSGDGFEVSATVTNTGDGRGTFDGVLQWQGQGDRARWLEDQDAEGTFRVELAAGESQDISVTVQRSDGTYAYRIAPFTETVELDFG